jgi:hypothetical protein
MDSGELTRRGFGRWLAFSEASAEALLFAMPTSPGVYCIRSVRERFASASGDTDILYIGCAAGSGGLAQRVRQYFHPGPTQWTNKRIRTRCCRNADYEIGFLECANGAAAQQLESELLHGFLRQHHQLPPENRQLPQPTAAATPSPDTRARRMVQAVWAAPMGRSTRTRLREMAEARDADGILRFLERCVATQIEVGRSIQEAGGVSFESRIGEVRRIYRERMQRQPLSATAGEADESLPGFADKALATGLWHEEQLAGDEEDQDGYEMTVDKADDASDDVEDYYPEGVYYDADRDEWIDEDDEPIR